MLYKPAWTSIPYLDGVRVCGDDTGPVGASAGTAGTSAPDEDLANTGKTSGDATSFHEAEAYAPR